MSRRKRAGWLPHRRLAMIEGLLLVGALELTAEEYVLASSLPGEAKVAVTMLLVVGFFGSLLLVFERLAKKSVKHPMVATSGFMSRFYE